MTRYLVEDATKRKIWCFASYRWMDDGCRCL